MPSQSQTELEFFENSRSENKVKKSTNFLPLEGRDYLFYEKNSN